MPVFVAKRSGRIDVWPNTRIARCADTGVSKLFGRMTIWPTTRDARNNMECYCFDQDEAGMLGTMLMMEY